MNNPKRARFEKIASNRVQKILDTLMSLSNCSNKNNYEYSKDDADRMFRIIKEKVRETELVFQSKLNKSTSNTFKF
jgi:hypothetical protein